MAFNGEMQTFFHSQTGLVFWGSNHLATFVAELVEARRYVAFDHEESVDEVIAVVTAVMSSTYTHPYDKSFLKFHYGLLKRRYELFKYVVRFPLVRYDQETNRVRVPFLIQAAIMFDNPTAERYFLSGEPIWDELQFLFDDPQDWEDDHRIVTPDGDDDYYIIPNFFELSDVPLLTRMREREYKRIHNERLAMGH